MAKRRSQSTANDSTGVAATPKPKASRAAKPRRSLATAPEPVETVIEPTEDDIRHRAYLRYLERGGNGGDAFDDWLYAERELKKN